MDRTIHIFSLHILRRSLKPLPEPIALLFVEVCRWLLGGRYSLATKTPWRQSTATSGGWRRGWRPGRLDGWLWARLAIGLAAAVCSKNSGAPASASRNLIPLTGDTIPVQQHVMDDATHSHCLPSSRHLSKSNRPQLTGS